MARVVASALFSLATCNARTIDFFVVSHSLAHAFYSVTTVSDSLWYNGASGQHSPVRLTLAAKPNKLLTRQLKKVEKLPMI